MNRLRSNFIVLFMILFLFCVSQSNAESNFVRIKLPNSVTVELPRNWVVLSDSKRITLNTWKESVLDAHKLSEGVINSPFAANYYDDLGNTAGTFAIQYYPTITITQSEALAGGDKFIKEFDAGLHIKAKQGIDAAGGKLVTWIGTTKQSINGTIFLISEDRLLSPKGEGFHGKLIRYLNAEKSFTIIITYREDQEYYLRPICDRIISSIRR